MFNQHGSIPQIQYSDGSMQHYNDTESFPMDPFQSEYPASNNPHQPLTWEAHNSSLLSFPYPLPLDSPVPSAPHPAPTIPPQAFPTAVPTAVPSVSPSVPPSSSAFRRILPKPDPQSAPVYRTEHDKNLRNGRNDRRKKGNKRCCLPLVDDRDCGSTSTALVDEPIQHPTAPGPSCRPSLRTAKKGSITLSPHHCSVASLSEHSMSDWKYTPRETTIAVTDRTGTAVDMMPIVTETKQQHLEKAKCLLQQLQGIALEFHILKDGIDELTHWVQRMQATDPCMGVLSATVPIQAELSGQNCNNDHSQYFSRSSQDVKLIEQVSQMIKSLESHLVMLDVSEKEQMYLKLGRLLERLEQANNLLEDNSSLSASR